MMKTLRLAFAGTPEFAATILQGVLERSDYPIEWVMTPPEKRAGRGRRLVASAVKTLALERGLKVLQPAATDLVAIKDQLSRVDVMLVAAYGAILPAAVLDAPRHGCINVHSSLLPRWRGAAPIQRALLAGDHETGISIIQMDDRLDTGQILRQKKCTIHPTDTLGSLSEKLATMGIEVLLNTLDAIVSGNLQPSPQDESHACYAHKISKSETEIDWSQSAVTIERAVRAFNPTPVCHTTLAGVPLRVWRATIVEQHAVAAGMITACSAAGIDVATGGGTLRILELQPTGKRVMSTADFLNGHPTFGITH